MSTTSADRVPTFSDPLPVGWRPMLADPHAAHQIKISVRQPDVMLAVACTCQAHGEIIDDAQLWPEGAAVRAWKTWHNERGIEL